LTYKRVCALEEADDALKEADEILSSEAFFVPMFRRRLRKRVADLVEEA
jgi:hypothetical protein